jgi:O-antigen/teichoic acid export membrane protein
VSFFSFPFRLLMSSAEGLAKVADVTSSVTAGLDEAQRTDQVWRLAVTVNRACFTLFMPVAIFLALYGTELLRVWTPAIAEQSGPLIPILLVMFLFGVAGQYNAGAILIGQGRHSLYSFAVVVEVIASVAILLAFGRQYGAEAAAWASSLTFVLNRGLFLAALICWQNGFSLGRYLTAIYAMPLAAAVPVVALTASLKGTFLPGHTWVQLIAAGGLLTCAYFGAAWFLVLSPEQRAGVRSQAARFSMR